MSAPLIKIRFDSIYNGMLPKRMAYCSPDLHAALFRLKQKLLDLDADLILSDLFRTYDMQYQAYLDYITGKKKAYSPPPGGSLHEAGRAFDLDLSKLKKIGLAKFWTIAAKEGVSPIVNAPDPRLSEAWHFERRGSHKLVYDYYAAGNGDNFKTPYKAMAASAILAIGQRVDAFEDNQTDAYIQSGLIRLGQNIGDLDGLIGPKTRIALQAIAIDDTMPPNKIAAALDQKLQEAFAEEFFTEGVTIAADEQPDHIAA